MNGRRQAILFVFLLLVAACAAPKLRPRAWEDLSGETGLASW